MNFSADHAPRKWPSRRGASLSLPLSLVFWFAVVLTVGAAIEASANVPLPRPRPADAPATVDVKTGGADESLLTQKPADAKPVVSACRAALTEDIAVAPSIPPIKGQGGCGGEDLVRLEAVMLSRTERVAVKPAAILRCTMATAVADWVRSDLAPLAAKVGTTITELDNFDSFECRGRNRIRGAKLSEHGLANALDVRGVRFANGSTLSLTDRSASRELREKVLASVCARFNTVLGPGSDWYHEDHIHLDLAQRRSNYKLCQWGVYDPLPAVPPLLPADRPEEAPPRPIAEGKVSEKPVDVPEAASGDDGGQSAAPVKQRGR